MTDAHGDASFVACDIVNAIRNRLAEFFVRKIMRFDFSRLFLLSVSFSRVFQVSQRLLLFRVDRDRWLFGALKRLHPGGNALELSVTIGVLLAFHRFAVGLQTIPLRSQQLPNLCAADFKTLYPKLLRQIACAITNPTYRAHRIAPC